MSLIKASSLQPWRITSSPPLNVITITYRTCFFAPLRSATKFSFNFRSLPYIPIKPLILHGKKRNSDSEPVLEPTIAQQVSDNEEEDDEEDFFLDKQSEYGKTALNLSTLILFFFLSPNSQFMLLFAQRHNWTRTSTTLTVTRKRILTMKRKRMVCPM